MVVDYGHLVGSEIGPLEDDAPLFVDTDRMEARAAVAEPRDDCREATKIAQERSLIHLNQLSQRYSRNRGKPPVYSVSNSC